MQEVFLRARKSKLFGDTARLLNFFLGEGSTSFRLAADLAGQHRAAPAGTGTVSGGCGRHVTETAGERLVLDPNQPTQKAAEGGG